MKQNECKDIDIPLDENSFDITLGSIKTINLFASHAINNTNSSKAENTNAFHSIKLGNTDWKFEFYQMPTDNSHDIYQFLDGLFGDKLCDWKEYIIQNEKDSKSSNNFVAILLKMDLVFGVVQFYL